jgi:hypothetical protein
MPLLFMAVLAVIGLSVPAGVAAHNSRAIEPRPTPGEAAFAGYKGINVGMTTDAVRKALGVPKDKSDAMDLYVFSDNESAQFYYDGAHLVTAMMITYSGDLKKAPTPKDVFGEDVAPKADGGIFKMVRDPKAGYWISYNRTVGDDQIVNIAVQKI